IAFTVAPVSLLPRNSSAAGSGGRPASVPARRRTGGGSCVGGEKSVSQSRNLTGSSGPATKTTTNRGAFRDPAHLVAPHPLDTHWPTIDCPRQQCGITRGVLMSITTVTAGPFHVDAVHIVRRQRQHCCKLSLEAIGCL